MVVGGRSHRWHQELYHRKTHVRVTDRAVARAHTRTGGDRNPSAEGTLGRQRRPGHDLQSHPMPNQRHHTLADSTLYATTPDMFSDSERRCFDALSQATRFRIFGADCYAYGLLSAGHVELVAESNMAPHDFLALVPVVEGAGGMITDWQGNPLDLLAGRQVLATANPTLHEQALARLDPATAS